MAVVALETTVVVTALPTIAGELDRLDLYPWVFSAYLLTSTVTVPLYGKLADVFGRRRVFLFGMVVFLAGSILCGLARGMTELVVFRAIQGLGAGAVMPSIFTVVADLYRLHERAKVQGVFSTLWGIASLIGPGLGAWLTITWSWRAVFFIGVPFGLAASIFFICFFKERIEPRKVSLDIAGSLLLMVGLTALLLALTQGTEGPGWTSPLVLGLLAASVLMLVGFIVVERRAPDPVLPLDLFKLRVMSVSSAANFLSGAVLFGVTSYVPLFVQGARGEGAAGAGAALTPMLVTWSLSGFVGPRLLLRFGFRATAIGSTLLIALGAAGPGDREPGRPADRALRLDGAVRLRVRTEHVGVHDPGPGGRALEPARRGDLLDAALPQPRRHDRRGAARLDPPRQPDRPHHGGRSGCVGDRLAAGAARRLGERRRGRAPRSARRAPSSRSSG